MQNLIDSYLHELERQLRSKGMFNADTLAELESHLLDSVEANVQRGLNQAEAEKEALRRFGSVRIVSAMFESERIRPMQKILLAIAIVSGWFITYVDSRPTWDDTGITAGVILLLCGLLALIGFKRPWLLALMVGGWIPLYAFFITHNFASVLALVIAFIGAYAGWAVHLGIRKIYEPA